MHTFGGFQTYQWILAVAAALCLGMSKTGFVGLNLLGIALMASVWPARESTGVILPMLVFGDFFGVAAFHRHALWPEIWRVLPPALAGVVIGFGIFQVLPAPLFCARDRLDDPRAAGSPDLAAQRGCCAIISLPVRPERG